MHLPNSGWVLQHKDVLSNTYPSTSANHTKLKTQTQTHIYTYIFIYKLDKSCKNLTIIKEIHFFFQSVNTTYQRRKGGQEAKQKKKLSHWPLLIFIFRFVIVFKPCFVLIKNDVFHSYLY